MKRIPWQVFLGAVLVLLSAALYCLHFLIYRDLHHIFIYLLGDLAFMPVEVLLVTFIIHQLLNSREKRSRLEKLNMVIGSFFSEVGTRLLTYVSDCDPELDAVRTDLLVKANWTAREFQAVSRRLKSHQYRIAIAMVDLDALKKILVGKSDFLVRLLENPSLLEHETFTDLLRAVFHLTEELESREKLRGLPASDLAHLAGDIHRAYRLLAAEWLAYMKYLQEAYPYLFSLSIRLNPFDRHASPIVY